MTSITFNDILAKDLRIMDPAAIALARDNDDSGNCVLHPRSPAPWSMSCRAAGTSRRDKELTIHGPPAPFRRQ